jgi:hypothetical protein
MAVAGAHRLPPGTVLDGELVCLQPVDGGRVRRFDRLGGFMRAPQRACAARNAQRATRDAGEQTEGP